VDEIKLEDLIADTEMLITVSHAGYIKRTAADTYRHQSRGGKGRIGAKDQGKKISSSICSLLGAQLHPVVHVQGPRLRLKVYDCRTAGGGTPRQSLFRV